MTKKELYAAVSDIVEKYGIEGEAKNELLALVEPKKAGARFDIDEVACRDEEGTVTHIFDSVLHVWIPVYDTDGEANFYEKPDTELGWSCFSRLAEKLRKENEKKFKATKEAVLNDLLNGAITQEEGKQLLEEAEEARKTFVIPEGFEYSEERPCA
jgi:hypothetical protein